MFTDVKFLKEWSFQSYTSTTNITLSIQTQKIGIFLAKLIRLLVDFYNVTVDNKPVVSVFQTIFFPYCIIQQVI